MSDRLLKAADIAARYSVSVCTARRYMRNMDHLESPLRVWMSEVLRWEEKRKMPPVSYVKTYQKFMDAQKKAILRMNRGV